MNKRYKFYNPNSLYFVSFSTVFWVSVFIREIYCEILIEQLKYCQKNKGLVLYAYCIMSNHVHLIFKSTQGHPSELLRDYKKYTSRLIVQTIRENSKESRRDWMLFMFKYAAYLEKWKSHNQFWQFNSHPIELYSNKVIDQKLNYIHQNPVVAGYVEKPYFWKYSSARNYMSDDDSLIKVELIS